jgi:hypothetical protein
MSFHFKCTALLVLVLAWPMQARAGVDWSVIHCGGTGYHDGTEPPNENPSSSTTQCHGIPGEEGSCTGVNSFANFSVTCSVTGASGVKRCFGNLSCTGTNSTYTCGGQGYQAFAGVQAVGDGSNLGFLKCIKPDDTELKYECPSGIA